MWITDKKSKKSVTFEELALEWLENKKKEVKESTYVNYLYEIQKYLIDKYKDITLDKLENVNFNEHIEELGKELKPKTIRDIIVKLKAILGYANEMYHCNIKIRKIKSPKPDDEPLIILNKEEREKLEKYCLDNKELRSIGILISLNTGLRIGEICATFSKT